jgi:hypothetical protein
LALRKLAKRDVVERSFSDLAAARQGADEARYDLGRRLTEVCVVGVLGWLRVGHLEVQGNRQQVEEGGAGVCSTLW